MENNEGNAEIMGVVLLIAIFVGAITLMGVMMLSAPQPEKVPAVAFDFWTNDSHTNISLVHRGGETLNLSGSQLKVIYSDGSSSENPAVGIDGGSAKSWSEVSASSTYGIGNSINFTTNRSVDQVQLVWPGTGGASMTGGGGPVLLGAWSTNSSSGKNPPAAVTGAVPITFPYPSEGPTRAQPTQTPAVPWVYFIADKTAVNEKALGINFTNLTENQGTYGLLWDFGDGNPTPSLTKSITHNYSEPALPSNIENHTVKLTLTDSNGPTQYNLSRPYYISVYRSPVASFITNLTPPYEYEGNSGMNVIFTNKTTGYVTSLFWDFDDKTSSPYPNPSHIFNSSPSILRNYTVKLTASVDLKESHEKNTFQQNITVHPQVIANFTATPTTGPAPLTVSFNSSDSRGYDLTYTWDFGDGTTNQTEQHEQNPQHTYTTAGNYTATLMVGNTLPGPNTSTTSRNITVTAPPLAPPVANFTATPMNGTAPLAVTFTDTSINNPTSWFWDFGDGNTSTQQNPVNIYTQLGNHNVTLTATNSAGSNTSAPQTIFVYNNLDTIRVDAGNGTYTDCLGNVWLADQVYKAGEWGYSPAGAPIYSTNAFIGNTSDPNLYQTSRWSNTSTVDYLFNVPNGNYNVQMKFAETDTSINTGNHRKFDVDVNGYRVASDFNVYGTVGPNSTADLFSNVTVTDNRIHVVLEGTTGPAPMIAAISIAPASTWVSPEFTANQTIGNAQLPVQFTEMSTGNVTKRFWDFGDGSTSTQQNPAHTYTAAGTYTVMLTAGNDNQSRTVVKQDYITVGPALTADFTANTTTGIAPLAVGFTDRSIGNGINNWSWNFGDGNTSNVQNATHTYTSPGTYTVNLTIRNPYGNASTTKTGFITIHSLNPDFRGNQTTGNAPLTVSFTDTSTRDINIDTWTWNFGDGNTSTTQNPVYQYQKNGTYDVSLRITNTTLGTNTTTKLGYITVLPQLIPNFTANTTAGNAALNVQFTDTSTGSSIGGWNWNFGDGNTSTTRDPQHTYTTNGTYTVTLTINNTYGNASTTKTGYITVYPPLVAAFGGAPLLGNAPLNVSFVDQSTGYTIDGWNWSFGDGTTSTAQNPSHIYTAAGNYTVNLTITNAYGNATVSKPAFVTVMPQLVANFTANQTIGNAQLLIQFTDTSTGSGINNWNWDFGDNTTASNQNPQHTYSTAGTYTVNLTISNGYGNNTMTRTGYITVLNPPVANFIGTPTVGNSQANVQFNDLSSGDGITNWTWTFGDGNTSIIRNATHLYTTPGSYNVTLTINNTYGSSTITKTGYITVYPPLIANFTTTATTGEAPLEVDFTDTSTGHDIIGWTWDFGDGSPMASLQNVSHTYTTAGTYTVTLTVTNPVGSAQATRTITVTAPVTTPTPSGAAIIGTIYNDQNGDGLANTTDPKLAGWTINLLQNNVVIATTTSDASGAYGFYGLQNGKKYYVKEVLPVGWQGTNPTGGSSAEIHITGNDQVTRNFWNYNTMIGGGDILLNTNKPGHLVSGGYLQFTSMGTDSDISVSTIVEPIPANQGDIVKIVLLSDGVGTISMSGGKINSMQLPNAEVYINNALKGTGQITGADFHNGYSNLISTLAVTVPSQNVWTSFTVHGLSVIGGQNDNRVINLYNVSDRNSDSLFNLNVNTNSIWIQGSVGSYQLISP